MISKKNLQVIGLLTLVGGFIFPQVSMGEDCEQAGLVAENACVQKLKEKGYITHGQDVRMTVMSSWCHGVAALVKANCYKEHPGGSW